MVQHGSLAGPIDAGMPPDPSIAGFFLAPAWRHDADGHKAASGGQSKRPDPASTPGRRTRFSEQFRSVSEFPRYLTQGMDMNSA
jgi:hypothetical protein